MRERIFTIEDHFQINGRGLIVVGKVEKNSAELRIGTPLIIVTPDGREIKTKFGGFEMFSPPNFESLAIMIHELTKDEVPIGSTIFKDEN